VHLNIVVTDVVAHFRDVTVFIEQCRVTGEVAGSEPVVQEVLFGERQEVSHIRQRAVDDWSGGQRRLNTTGEVDSRPT
jgi:hypothetical protein